MAMYQKLDQDASRIFIQAGTWDVQILKSERGEDGTGMLGDNASISGETFDLSVHFKACEIKRLFSPSDIKSASIV
jgi:hypothetical protein